MYFLCLNNMMTEFPTLEKSCGYYVVPKHTHNYYFMDPGSNLPCLYDSTKVKRA